MARTPFFQRGDLSSGVGFSGCLRLNSECCVGDGLTPNVKQKVKRMATVKKGVLTASSEWWKHLRWRKRVFWKGERRAAKRFAQREADSDACKDKGRAE